MDTKYVSTPESLNCHETSPAAVGRGTRAGNRLLPSLPDVCADASVDQIKSAFKWRNDWRTLKAIARAVGMQQEVVCCCLDSHPEIFEPSPTRFMGQILYRFKKLN